MIPLADKRGNKTLICNCLPTKTDGICFSSASQMTCKYKQELRESLDLSIEVIYQTNQTKKRRIGNILMKNANIPMGKFEPWGLGGVGWGHTFSEASL